MGISQEEWYIIPSKFMSNKTDIEILPEDRVKLTQEQENLIFLALEKQVPPENAKFLEKVKSKAETEDPFSEILGYFVTKYGKEFGILYVAAITGGEEKYNEVVESIEEERASERLKRGSLN